MQKVPQRWAQARWRRPHWLQGEIWPVSASKPYPFHGRFAKGNTDFSLPSLENFFLLIALAGLGVLSLGAADDLAKKSWAGCSEMSLPLVWWGTGLLSSSRLRPGLLFLDSVLFVNGTAAAVTVQSWPRAPTVAHVLARTFKPTAGIFITLLLYNWVRRGLDALSNWLEIIQ